jgi:hypothetical protein
MNNEAKVRRSTRSLKLGPGKVMSYKDLEEARVTRAAKEVIKSKSKGKRGRKRKSNILELDKLELEPGLKPELEGACATREIINSRGKRG